MLVGGGKHRIYLLHPLDWISEKNFFKEKNTFMDVEGMLYGRFNCNDIGYDRGLVFFFSSIYLYLYFKFM